jgi:branched-chain amino acid transport system permease protein
MSAFLQYAFSGITSGSIYALAALGLTIVFNARNVINFAQGSFLMLGGMITAALIPVGVPLALAVLSATAITVAVGALVHRLAIAPARNADPVNLIIITIGASIFIDGVAAVVFGKNQHMVPSFSGDAPIRVLDASLLPQSLWVLATAALLVAGVTWYFRGTLAGKAMRAVSINETAASLVGVRPDRFLMVAFCLSAFLGAMAGAVSSPITTTVYDIGLILGLKGFVGATLGGLGSALGAVIGGLLVGLFESFVAGYVSTAYKDAVPFVLIIGILLFMPQGLLGSRIKERV